MSNYWNCFVINKIKCISSEILNDINTMSCPMKVNSNTIELTVHTPCYCILDYSVLPLMGDG